MRRRDGTVTVLRRLGPALAVALILGLAAPNNVRADAGREAFERGDYATAYGIWKPLAEQGFAGAQHNIGVLYRYGLGVEKDFSLAVKWFGRAAAQGDADAELALGDLYAEYSTSKEDDAAAAKWYRAAAEHGLAEAERKLGMLYGEGRGVPQDQAEAAKWFARAAEAGDADANERLSQMSNPGGEKKVEADRERPVKAGRDVAQAQCTGDPDRAYKLEMHLDVPRARLHEDRGIDELGEMSFHGPNARVLGLTNTQLEFGWHVQFAATPLGDGYCFWVARVDLSLRYPSPDVYVAREYRPGSCPYRAVLHHEEEHVAITRRIVEHYGPRLETALTSLLIPTGLRPMVVDSADEAKGEMQALMKELVDPIYREMMAELRQAHGELDSPRSYRAARKRCPRW
jgi:TPR repeat protein